MYPVLVRVGHVALPTFGVLAAIGLMGGLVLSQRTARLAGVDADELWDAGLFAVIAAFRLLAGAAGVGAPAKLPRVSFAAAGGAFADGFGLVADGGGDGGVALAEAGARGGGRSMRGRRAGRWCGGSWRWGIGRRGRIRD